MSEVVVRIEDVSFHYPKSPAVLHRCNMELHRGKVLALLGPNGSGKTTLLRLIIGALLPTSGSVHVHGRTGYVPQLLQLSFSYSVREVVLMGRARHVGLFSTPSRSDENAAMAALERVGIAHLALRPFDELSGGERQLTAFARALAAAADILVLDEPTASLDLAHQCEVLEWIRVLARQDLTIVFSTHQPQHADAVADDAAILGVNHELITGSASEILRPALLKGVFGVDIARLPTDGDPRGVLVTDYGH